MSFEICRQPHAKVGDDELFSSKGWLQLLQHGFGCQTFSIHDRQSDRIVGVSVFKAGPFRLGYLGFPVGGHLGSAERYAELGHFMRKLPSNLKPQCLRIAVSGFDESVALPLKGLQTPETAISDLQVWSPMGASKNVRRDLAKAQKAGLEPNDARDPGLGEEIYQLYKATIQRHQGALRYTKAYFQHLVALSTKLSNLRVMTVPISGSTAAFLVVGRHAGSGYYLHGGSDPQLRQHRPAAMLMHEAITWAQQAGCHRFNFMSSPPHQPSLVQYKEKWGGTTRDHWTYTMPLRPSYGLFRLAESIYRIARR